MENQTAFFKHKLEFETDPSDLYGALENGERIIVVDTRSKESFEKEHIPGAISFPHRTMNAETTSHLDKSLVYVTYCTGVGCNASTKGAYNLSGLGFKVKELIGGFECWKRDGYATEGKNCALENKSSCGCN